MALEIERKFEINALGHAWVKSWFETNPEYGIVGGPQFIDQGYLTDDKNKTVRIRCVGNNKFEFEGYVTRKTPIGNGGLVCEEEEYSINPFAAKILLEECQWRVAKTRYKITHNGNVWDFDCFTDKGNAGLIVAELEFPTIEAANAFTDLPPWIGHEVTEDSRYKNYCLAKFPHLFWNYS